MCLPPNIRGNVFERANKVDNGNTDSRAMRRLDLMAKALT